MPSTRSIISGRRLWQRLSVGILGLLLLAGFGFALWAYTPLGPQPDRNLVLKSDGIVLVLEGTTSWIFQPQDGKPSTGFIFYPGARVDPRSYAETLRSIAAEGYLVALPRMPFNMAVFQPDRAADFLDRYPEIERWVIGGHSLGGAMAAKFAYQNSESLTGLILWAAFPASSDDLSGLSMRVLSLYGTKDGLVSPEEIADSRKLLPTDAIFLPIEGGNHAQFGRYGDQPGDLPALISSDEQQAQILTATLEFLGEIRADFDSGQEK